MFSRHDRSVALSLGVLAILAVSCVAWAQAPAEATKAPELIAVTKIWDGAPHNAFTDLVRFKEAFFCCFREGDGHVGGKDGVIRVIASADGAAWSSAALIEEAGIDLRDPKLSVTPDNRLMLTAGGSHYVNGQLLDRQPRVAFSADGRTWGPTQRVGRVDEWLWRTTWHEGRAYSVGYTGEVKSEAEWYCTLCQSPDGLKFEPITTFQIPGQPNEATLRFQADGTMLCFVRREAGNRFGWIGHSAAPYTNWKWHETNYAVGGPEFIVLPSGAMWAAGRRYDPQGLSVVVARFGLETYEPVLTLPSGGDCGYPGLAWHDGVLWMSYYSSHEGKTSIYLAKIRLPE